MGDYAGHVMVAPRGSILVPKHLLGRPVFIQVEEVEEIPAYCKPLPINAYRLRCFGGAPHVGERPEWRGLVDIEVFEQTFNEIISIANEFEQPDSLLCDVERCIRKGCMRAGVEPFSHSHGGYVALELESPSVHSNGRYLDSMDECREAQKMMIPNCGPYVIDDWGCAHVLSA